MKIVYILTKKVMTNYKMMSEHKHTGTQFTFMINGRTASLWAVSVIKSHPSSLHVMVKGAKAGGGGA